MQKTRTVTSRWNNEVQSSILGYLTYPPHIPSNYSPTHTTFAGLLIPQLKRHELYIRRNIHVTKLRSGIYMGVPVALLGFWGRFFIGV